MDLARYENGRLIIMELGDVLYRVIPYFRGDELIARGVEMEAYSVEDSGGIHVEY